MAWVKISLNANPNRAYPQLRERLVSSNGEPIYMSTDMSILHLVANASLVVQFVMLLLVIFSIFSWALIFAKWRMISEAKRNAIDFEERIWSCEDLTELYRHISHKRLPRKGMERIFETGYREFLRLLKLPSASADTIIAEAQRAMRVAMYKETHVLEVKLPFLATVGSTSPYIGLFGTVWGIMNSFRALGDVQQATIAMVAPGISEALIATAMGLAAAIPAVIAYNRFSNDTEQLINRYGNFIEEFSSILHRHSHN
ncbi:MAG: protein TolQ [Candidatus Eutrophobiaceae bacterium]